MPKPTPLASDDAQFVLRTLGCMPTLLGGVVVGFGGAYAVTEWRYWWAVLIWSLMWGLMLVGVGLVIMATGRRWLAALGALACTVSASLVFAWERTHSLGSWSLWIYPPDVFGVFFGLASIATATWRKPVTAPPAGSEDPPPAA
jgi:hypothetical protein